MGKTNGKYQNVEFKNIVSVVIIMKDTTFIWNFKPERNVYFLEDGIMLANVPKAST